MSDAKASRPADGLLTGGLLAAFTAAVAACGAGSANAATFAPVSFDLLGAATSPQSLTLNLGDSDVTVSSSYNSGSSPAYQITLNTTGSADVNFIFLTPTGYVSTFASPNDIGAYGSQYPFKTEASGVSPIVTGDGHVVTSSLASSGYLGLYDQTATTPYYISYTNTIVNEVGPSVLTSRQDDVFTITGYGSVPEPETWALLVLGIGGLGAALRRRRSMTAAAAA